MLEKQGSHWQNSEFQLKTWIAGSAHTTWEKYRLLCNQLENRFTSLAQSEASQKHHEAKLAKLEHLQEHGTKWEQLECEAALIEAEACFEVSRHCVDAARSEVEFIDSLIKLLSPELEATRLPGLTDQQMFQQVQSEEWTFELIQRAENYYISRLFGGFPPEQIDAMRSHPEFESKILPALKKLHLEYMPAIVQANTISSGSMQKILQENNGEQ